MIRDLKAMVRIRAEYNYLETLVKINSNCIIDNIFLKIRVRTSTKSAAHRLESYSKD